jgi:hypothetical protein
MSVGDMIHHAAIIQAIDFLSPPLAIPGSILTGRASKHSAVLVVAFRPKPR